MKIDGDTKVIGRLHKNFSLRGLNIYNPFFEEAGINAVYLLFHNPDPKPLVAGLRALNFAGAITVGFENDPKFAKLVDEFDEVSAYVKKVGFIVNANGVLKGSVQSGQSMFRTIQKAADMTGKKLVIVGAGDVTKAMLFYISHSNNQPKEVEIYNRTVEKAEELAKDFKFVKKIGPLSQLAKADGNILANISHLGGAVPDDLYSQEIVDKFSAIADVTFETENTNLVKLGRELKKKVATGWDMFTFQGQIALSTILQTEVSVELLGKHVRRGLSEVVK